MQKICTFLTLLLLAMPRTGKSCECFSKGRVTLEDYNSTTEIFMGRFIDEKEEGKYYKVRFLVLRGYKTAKEHDTVSILLSKYISDCGITTFPLNATYLLFAYSDTAGKLYTSRCSRSAYVRHQWPSDSTIIRKSLGYSSFSEIGNEPFSNFHADTFFLNKLELQRKNKGVQTFYTYNGKKSAKGAFVNLIANGPWTYYNSSGIISGAGIYKNGLKDGVWIDNDNSFSSNTYMKYVQVYRNGLLYYTKGLYFNGRLDERMYPIKGSDKWKKDFYHSNGKIRVSMTLGPIERTRSGYKNGRMNGLTTDWYENGKLESEEYFHEGIQCGTGKYYDTTGKLLKTRTFKNCP